MKVSKDDVLKVAELARLKIEATEVDQYTNNFNDILGYIERLNNVDTKSVEPSAHAVSMPTPFREDTLRPSLTPDQALANAPERFADFFVVPKVVE